MEGRDHDYESNSALYKKVNLTGYFYLHFACVKVNLTSIFVCITLKLFEFKRGPGMNGTVILMCDTVIYYLLIFCKVQNAFA